MALYHLQRTAEWGHWGITFMGVQPDVTRNFGTLYAKLDFPVTNGCGPQDSRLGDRPRYNAMIAAWIERGELPETAQRIREA